MQRAAARNFNGFAAKTQYYQAVGNFDTFLFLIS
jgi:hypothetical protein